MEAMLEGLRSIPLLLTRADSRLHWAFLLTSAGLALWLVATGRRRRSWWSVLVPWRLWATRSSLLDVQLLLANAVLRSTVLAPLTLSTMAVVLAIAGPMTRWLGPAPPSSLPAGIVVTAFTVAVFVADDLTRYLVHRAMHRIPVLWAFHRIHHSAEVLTPVTLHRVHPVESFIMATRYAVTAGTVTALFYVSFPGQLSQWELLGVNALSVVASALGSNLRHSHVWLSFGSRVERWLMSPAQHQVHHSVAAEHRDKNFGAFLSIWDRLAGSLCTTTRRGGQTTSPLTFGVLTKTHRDHLVSAWLAPFFDLYRRI